MKKVVPLVLCMLLSACASKPTQVNLVPTGIVRSVAPPLDMEVKTIAVVIADAPSQTGKVMVDATFPPLWKEAIQTSIDQAGLFKDDAATNVTIFATIKRFEFNPTGFSNKVDVNATYRIVDRSTGKELFNEDIVTSASSNAGETYNASVRLINLWNTATQENISKFIAAVKKKSEAAQPQG